MARLGPIRWRLGDTAAALAIQQRALETLEGAVGPDHPETAGSGVSLCEFLVLAGRISRETDALCERAIGSLERAPPAARTRLAYFLLRFAELRLLLGHPGDADSLLRRARAVGESGPYWSTDGLLYDSLAARLRR